MSESKFTPGPWRIGTPGPNGCYTIGTVRGLMTAMIAHSRNEPDQAIEAEANARLIAAAPELIEALCEGRRAIGDHYAPGDCYATGPLTGDDMRDLIECPACSFISMYEAVMAKATA